jgi:hypothetical protein
VSKQTASKTSGVGTMYVPSLRALRAAKRPETPDPSRAFKTLVSMKKR